MIHGERLAAIEKRIELPPPEQEVRIPSGRLNGFCCSLVSSGCRWDRDVSDARETGRTAAIPGSVGSGSSLKSAMDGRAGARRHAVDWCRPGGIGCHTAIVLAAGSIIAAPVRAQQAPDAEPVFEAASIKPNLSSDTARSFRVQPGGTIQATNVAVRHLMWQAYGLQDFQIIGGPSWTAPGVYAGFNHPACVWNRRRARSRNARVDAVRTLRHHREGAGGGFGWFATGDGDAPDSAANEVQSPNAHRVAGTANLQAHFGA